MRCQFFNLDSFFRLLCAALSGLIGVYTAPIVAFVAIPVVLVALIAIGFYLLASNPNENGYLNQLSNSVEK